MQNGWVFPFCCNQGVALRHDPGRTRTFNLTIKRHIVASPHSHIQWYCVHYVQCMGVNMSIESIVYILCTHYAPELHQEMKSGKAILLSHNCEFNERMMHLPYL